jgi:hypothetical protein
MRSSSEQRDAHRLNVERFHRLGKRERLGDAADLDGETRL